MFKTSSIQRAARGGLAAALLASAAATTHATPLAVNSHDLDLDAMLQLHADEVRRAPDDRFERIGQVDAPTGETHVRLRRFHRDLPVLGGDLVLHLDRFGGYAGSSLTQTQPLRIITEPVVSAAMARQSALSLGPDNFQVKNLILAIDARKPEARLVWQVRLVGRAADDMPIDRDVLIDARDRSVRGAIEHVHRADLVAATGTGHSLYSGDVVMNTTATHDGFVLRDSVRADQAVYDLGNHLSFVLFGHLWFGGQPMLDADNVWGNGSPDDRASAATDAHHAAALSWDYFATTFGYLGIDGQGAPMDTRVHYGDDFDNAAWIPECQCAFFGDGNPDIHHQLVSIDLVAHELTHGVVEHTAGLIIDDAAGAESGGLNEGIADIYGAMVEFFADSPSDPGDWVGGEKLLIANDGVESPVDAIRYMFKPSLSGQQEDCWFDGIGELGGHVALGPMDHWFYLLSEGAVVPAGYALSPQDLVCNGNTDLSAIGRQAASAILFRAMQIYLTSASDYAGARTATLAAAADLYGEDAREWQAVAAAWSAVGVDSETAALR